MLRSGARVATRMSVRQIAKNTLCTFSARTLSTMRVSTMNSTFVKANTVSMKKNVTLVKACGFSSASLPPHEVLTMPSLSPTMEQGTIQSWAKQVGDEVRAGDVIANIETDKASVSFDSTEDGYIAKILVDANIPNIPIGTPIAILVEDAADIAAFANYTVDAAPAAAAETPAAAAAAAPVVEAAAPVATPAATPAAAAAPVNTGARVLATPAARILAAERGIDIAAVPGTAALNAITKADVAEFVPAATTAAAQKPAATTTAAAAAGVAPTGDYVDEPLTAMRSTIAKRLTESKQTVPHYYVTVEIDMTNVNKLRSTLNKTLAENAKKSDTPAVKLSVNDFVIKACAAALRKVPQVNASWQGNAIRKYDYVDISVAVSTDTGLITPIIADADIKGFSTISTDMKALAAKARAGKLQPEEFIGGTFTVSNLGMFGVKHFTSIINPPQAGILAVGASEEKVIKNPAATEENGLFPFTTVSVMNVTASFDHRVVDGAVGAQWLAAFKEYMENPMKLLL